MTILWPFIYYKSRSIDWTFQIFLLVPLFLLSSYNFRPSLLSPLLVKNLSFFQTCEVCWNRDTGSFFFFLLTGVFNLNVYAAVSGLLLGNCDDWETPELFSIILDFWLMIAFYANFGFNWKSCYYYGYSTSRSYFIVTILCLRWSTDLLALRNLTWSK